MSIDYAKRPKGRLTQKGGLYMKKYNIVLKQQQDKGLKNGLKRMVLIMNRLSMVNIFILVSEPPNTRRAL